MTKEELLEYGTLKKELEDLNERIAKKESQIMSAKVQVLTGMPRGGNNETDRIGTAIAEIEKMKNEYLSKLIELTTLEKRIEDEIKKLGSIERLVIRWRYYDCLKWDDICSRLGRTWKQVRKIHEKSLEKLSKRA